MKKVYFLRHGQTELNKKSVHQFDNTPLSEKGIRQAKKIRSKIEKLKIDCIISSPHARALQTATIVSENLNLPIETNDLFKELIRPTELRGVSWFSPKSLWIMGNLYFRANQANWHYSDEENLEEFHLRAGEALQYLANRKEENILVVTHRGLMANMIGRIKRDGLDTIAQYRRSLWKNLVIGNCCLFEAEWSSEGEYGDTLDGTWTPMEEFKCPFKP